MYIVTTNGDTTTADSIPEALDALRALLRQHLAAGGTTTWSITDPAGTPHRGSNNLRGRTDQLDDTITEIDSWLYIQLHRAADHG